MKLSENFSLREFTRSQTALRKNIDNSPNMEQLVNLTALSNMCLQPIRNTHGPVSLNSGLRVLELNRAIGSGDGSDHVKGRAADIEANSISNYELAKWCKENLSSKDTNKGLTDNMSNIELAISNLTDTISTIKLYK